MLKRLSIKNYAIIDEAEIHFDKRLNIMTGETGAGKSIILGALALLSGERADSLTVQQGKIKCVLEAMFQDEQEEVKQFLSSNEFDQHNNEIILRREVYSVGKSRAFINDTPATLQQLSEVSDYLIDIHRQHQTGSLQQNSFQLFVLDSLASNQRLLENFKQQFKRWQEKLTRLEASKEQYYKLQAEYEFNQYQLNELTTAQLTDNQEQEKLEAELKMLENAEELQQKFDELLLMIEQGEVNILSLMKMAQSQLQSIAKKLPLAETLSNKMLDLREQLVDINSEAEDLLNKIENNPQRKDDVQERLNILFHLQKKHRVPDVESLLYIQHRLEQQVNGIGELDQEIILLQAECEQHFHDLIQTAKEISQKRTESIPLFEKQLKELLKSVGMPHAVLHVQQEIIDDDQVLPTGLDKIEFLFSANKGFQPQPLQKIASGGELSRLMLCIKNIIAKSVSLPTLVFDEIDTGISGETAQRVGLLMKQIAASHQVICITHLPQMAAKADTHFYIYKENNESKTHTYIRQLSQEDRIYEIAKMLSGEKPGMAAMQNAKELIDL